MVHPLFTSGARIGGKWPSVETGQAALSMQPIQWCYTECKGGFHPSIKHQVYSLHTHARTHTHWEQPDMLTRPVRPGRRQVHSWTKVKKDRSQAFLRWTLCFNMSADGSLSALWTCEWEVMAQYVCSFCPQKLSFNGYCLKGGCSVLFLFNVWTAFIDTYWSCTVSILWLVMTWTSGNHIKKGQKTTLIPFNGCFITRLS